MGCWLWYLVNSYDIEIWQNMLITATSRVYLRGRWMIVILIGHNCFCTCISREKKRTVSKIIWTASSEFGTYRLCEQRRFRRACASAQSRQNLRYSLIQAVSQEEPSDRKPDPWPLWMAVHAQLKFVMTECLKTQIRLTGLIWLNEVIIILGAELHQLATLATVWF